MLEWLIAADDFTGALDVAVQFAKNGYEVLASIDAEYDPGACPAGIQVLVVDTQTRHLSPEGSTRALFRLTRRALDAGVPNILKKTDSALRGNIGAELAAVAQAAGKAVIFAPAFPKMNRITVEGIHYIDSVPVQESVFGRDPFEPVKSSSVEEIIRSQADLPVRSITPEEITGGAAPCAVFIVNAATEEDLALTAERIACQAPPCLAAGCAGLAGAIAGRGAKPNTARPAKTEAFVAVSGSVNPISLAQGVYAQKAGFHVITLSPELKLADYSRPENRHRLEMELRRQLAGRTSPKILIRAAESQADLAATDALAAQSGLGGEVLRRRIAAALGAVASTCLGLLPEACHMLVGGDTLRAFMEDAGLSEIKPLLELLPGVALSRLMYRGTAVQLISKSGGFGDQRTLAALAAQLL